MNRFVTFLCAAIITCTVCVPLYGFWKYRQEAMSKPPDPMVNLKLTLPQASSIVYSLRYSTILDAKTANDLADVVISQINDTTLNRQLKVIPPITTKDSTRKHK